MKPKTFVNRIKQFNREEEFLGDMSGLGKAFWLIEDMSHMNRWFIWSYIQLFRRDLIWLFKMWKNFRSISLS